MPANLTPDYLAAEKSYREAREPEEKLRYLELMLATIPKHKGTDRMQGDIKRRISKTKDLLEKKAGAKRHNPFKVEREGIGQIAICGAPNAGKSALVSYLTNAKCLVAEYPYATTKPNPGMMHFENVQIQLVDLPPISPEFTEPVMVGMIRNTDGVILIFDLSVEDPVSEIEGVFDVLKKHKVFLSNCATQKFTPDGLVYLGAILFGNKLDAPGAAEKLKKVIELYEKDFPIFEGSALHGTGLEGVRGRIFDMLDMVRVYTKSPGKKPDMDDPVVLKQGSTLMDFAATIHKDFLTSLKFARIWSKDPRKYDGQKVNRDEILTDGDIIELHK